VIGGLRRGEDHDRRCHAHLEAPIYGVTPDPGRRKMTRLGGGEDDGLREKITAGNILSLVS